MHAVTVEGVQKQLVLLGAQAVHRQCGRVVVGSAVGQLDVAALQEGPDAVLAGLAVDVGEVVGLGVEGVEVRTGLL